MTYSVFIIIIVEYVYTVYSGEFPVICDRVELHFRHQTAATVVCREYSLLILY